MNKNRKAAALRACLAMLVAVGLLGGAGVARAQEKPAAAPVAPASEIKDERALKRLQAMSDTLAGAKTLRFQYRGLLPVTGPTGQYVNLMASASVVMQRPDRLRVQARGDLFPSDLFHDGKTVTVVAANPKVYAQREAAGSLVESFTRGPQPGGDLVTPFIDLLATDPFAVLTRDLTSAIWVGQSKVGGNSAPSCTATRSPERHTMRARFSAMSATAQTSRKAPRRRPVHASCSASTRSSAAPMGA